MDIGCWILDIGCRQITNKRIGSVKKKIDLPKMPWTVRVPMLELYSLAVFCVGYAVYLTSPLTAISEGFLLFFALIFFWFGYSLQRGREDVAELIVVLIMICGVLGAGLSFSILQNWILGCFVLAFTLPVLLLCLPSARRWFAAVGTMRSTKKSSSGCLGVTARGNR